MRHVAWAQNQGPTASRFRVQGPGLGLRTLMAEWLDEPIKYKYVTKRMPGNISRMAPGFYAVHQNRSVGPFQKQAAAASAASKLSGLPVRNLFKTPPVESPQMTRLSQYCTNWGQCWVIFDLEVQGPGPGQGLSCFMNLQGVLSSGCVPLNIDMCIYVSHSTSAYLLLPLCEPVWQNKP